MPATSLEEIAMRAETGWPIDRVPYSQTAVWNDDDGQTDEDGYRRDCSGFASMAMRLAQPGLSTVTLVTTGATKRIEWSEMQRGDLVMLGGLGTGGNDGHVGVVVSVNRAANQYQMLEQSGGLGPDLNTYRIGTASRPNMLPYRSTFVTVTPILTKDDSMKLKREPNGSVWVLLDIIDPVTKKIVMRPVGNPTIWNSYGNVLGPTDQLERPIDWSFFIDERQVIQPTPGAGPSHEELVQAAFEGAQKAENQ